MRIILADHHVKPRWALQTLLQEQPQFNLVGVAEDEQSLLALVEKTPADLILVDRQLPESSIDDLIASFHALIPKPLVIVMSSEAEYSRMMLKAGADAFVSKSDEPDWLLGTLNRFEQRLRKAGE